MGKKTRGGRKAVLKKETIRALDQRLLSRDELDQVVGGYCKPTLRCTSNPQEH